MGAGRVPLMVEGDGRVAAEVVPAPGAGAAGAGVFIRGDGSAAKPGLAPQVRRLPPGALRAS